MPTTLSHPKLLAKARARRRTRDAGAVMFIVAMTLAIIAAMGMYALNIAATEVKTAGYIRQQTQAYYLSEFGELASTEEVKGPKVQMYRDLAIKTPDTNCTSLYGIPSTAGALPLACRRVGSAEIGSQWNPTAMPLSGKLLDPYVSNANENTRGSSGNPSAFDFYVEFTDPTQKTPPPGYSTEQGLCFLEFTAASVGITPLAAGAYMTEGLQTSRGRIIGGPIRCF
jgi:hypothetical protein